MSDREPLDLIERDFVVAAVVKFRRPGRLMIGDMLRHFQLSAVLQIGGDARRAEDMVANLRLDAGPFRAAGSCGRRLAGAWDFP